MSREEILTKPGENPEEKLDFEKFKENVRTKLSEYLPPRYKGYDVVITEVQKINYSYTGIYLYNPEKNAHTTIRIDDVYNMYASNPYMNASGALKVLADDVCTVYDGEKRAVYDGEELEPPDVNMEILNNFANAKDKIYFRLINAENNKKFLSGHPYKMYGDLSLVFCVKTGDADKDAESFAIITNAMMKNYGTNVNELYHLAKGNMQRDYAVTVKNIVQVLYDNAVKNGDTDEINLYNNLKPIDMYVISNYKNFWGGTTLTDRDALNRCAEILGDEIFIMPSSVHELIAVKGELNLQKLQGMVCNANKYAVRQEEFLSNEVYHFNAKKQTLTMMSTGKVIEPIIDNFEISQITGENVTAKQVHKPKAR